LFPNRSKPGFGPDTRQLLRIKVVAATAPDPQPATPILVPALMDPAPLADYSALDALTPGSPIPPLEPADGVDVDGTRNLTLNEDFDAWGRLIQKLGTDVSTGVSADGSGTPVFGRDLDEAATEVVAKNSTEIWQVFNTTGDTHPIHFHLVNVQILWRAPFTYSPATGFVIDTVNKRGPEPNEVGWKETVKMHPGEVIAVIMKFELPTVPFTVPSTPRAAFMGPQTSNPAKKYHEYVWHCHILEHEEHDMMRPLVVEE
jgi:spore coat protein A, manganese oxidase